MPKEEWELNSVDKIFGRANMWPWGKEDIMTILDVGCGLAFKSKFIPAQIRVGVDIFEEYFKHIESHVPYSVVKWDILKLSDIFIEDSFDLVVALDVIEHFVKKDALSIIGQCERVARKGVVLQTPKGFMHQNLDILGFGAHEYETHRSGWEPEELEALGYRCLLRQHRLSDVIRHTEIKYDSLDIQQIDAIKILSKSKGGK